MSHPPYPTGGCLHRWAMALTAVCRAQGSDQKPVSLIPSTTIMNGEMPMKKIIAVKNTVASRITAGLTRFVRDNRGEGYLDMAMKILIVVVVGAAILAIMNVAMPNLFQSLINKISGELTKVTVLP